MDEADTSPMAGKGKRVVGIFLLLLGAGIVLESTWWWLGAGVLLTGTGTLVRGALDARPRTLTAPHPHVVMDAQSESHP